MHQFGLLVLAVLLSVFFVAPSTHGAAVLIQADDDLSEEHYEAEVQCRTFDPPENKCLPQKCKRTVKDDIFSEADILKLREIAAKGFATRGEGAGGPTILDINTGYIRDPAGLDNLFNREGAGVIYTPEDFAHYGQIIAKLRGEVMSVTGAQDLFFTAPTFITKLDGRAGWEPKEWHDQYWHVHADRNNTAHYHYSGLLYLSMYGEDFAKGRVLFYDAESSAVEQVVEPRPGRVLIFTSGLENPHKVERVTSGQRLVLAFWFTCDPAKQFEIFLDGQAHTAFSQKVGASIRSAQAQKARQVAYEGEGKSAVGDAQDL